MVAGLLLVAGALWRLSAVEPTDGYGLVAASLALLGSGMGLLDAARSAFLQGMGAAVQVGAAAATLAALLVLLFLPARVPSQDGGVERTGGRDSDRDARMAPPMTSLSGARFPARGALQTAASWNA